MYICSNFWLTDTVDVDRECYGYFYFYCHVRSRRPLILCRQMPFHRSLWLMILSTTEPLFYGVVQGNVCRYC